MKSTSHARAIRHALLIALLACLGLLLAPRTAWAQAIIRGDTIADGEVVENDVILFGDVVRLAGTVEGNAFISGRDVVIDGHVEGSLFAIGQQITLNGTVDGGVYLLGVAARLGSTASVGQNLYFVGVSLVTERGSQIGRDLNGLSLGALLAGSVGREMRLLVGLVQFVNLFFNTALGPTPDVLPALAGRVPGLGQIVLPGEVYIDIIGQNTFAAQDGQPLPTQSELILDWLMARLREFLILLVVGLAGYWFLRRPLEASARVMQRRPWYTLGIGLVGLILAGAVAGAFILVFILILMTGLWIGRATFWNLTWLLWSLAFPFTALLFALLMVFLNHGTKVITTYAWTTFLVDRFAPRAGRVRWLWLVLGLVVYVLLRAIPTLGWVISVLVTAWGIGAAWLAWRQRKLPPAAVVAEPLPAPAGLPDIPADFHDASV